MRRPVLFSFVSLVVSLFLGSTSLGTVYSVSEYPFPYNDPYYATLTSRLLMPSPGAGTILKLKSLPGRERTPLFGHRSEVDVAVFAQPHAAPLVYVIPGIGGAATDGAALFLAEQLFRQGYSAIVVPSPFNWQFVLSQSTSAIPGFTPEDVLDLRRAMAQVEARARRELGLKPSRKAVLGYSLGGIQAGYLMKSERENPALGVERAVMINAPLDIPYAIAELDELNAIGNKWTMKERSILWGYVTNKASEVMSGRPDPRMIAQLDRILGISSEAVQYLIGNSFRQTLADTIFLSQQITDVGILRTPASWFDRGARQAEAATITFGQYMTRGAWPYWSKRLGQRKTLEEFVAQGDLASIRELIIRDSAFRLIHNSDDYLTRPADLQALAEAMGPRAVVYPRGGHIGNLWNPMTLMDIMKQLNDLK